MIIVWLFAIVVYLLLNLLTTITWLDDDIKHKGIVAVIFMIAGLPIMIVVVAVSIVLGIVEVMKK